VEPSREERILPPPQWLDAAPVTRTLLVLNIAVFVMQVVLASEPNSVMHMPAKDVLTFGGNSPLAVLGDGRWETLVTACFLHFSIFHVGMNMLALWQAGPLVERAVGSARMAPLYLFAGAFSSAVSAAYHIFRFQEVVGAGASGAISGVIAAAMVVGWRVQGWRGPLTQAMVRWLGFVVVFGLVIPNIDNAAHIGGAIAGASIAAMWQRGYRYTARATKAILAGCGALVAACVVVVGVRDRVDRFATLNLQERYDFTIAALAGGHCRDAYDGLHAVDRLRSSLAPVTPLRAQVEASCGRRP
jgi:rhomboid protease GluP